MRAKLRIRFVVFEGALAMQILDQPEEWREEGELRASNGLTVFAGARPMHISAGVGIRGTNTVKDLAVYSFEITDPAALRDKYIQAITEFVAHMDGEKKVDVSGLLGRLNRLKYTACYERGMEKGIEMAITEIEACAKGDTKSPTVNGDVWEW